MTACSFGNLSLKKTPATLISEESITKPRNNFVYCTVGTQQKKPVSTKRTVYRNRTPITLDTGELLRYMYRQFK